MASHIFNSASVAKLTLSSIDSRGAFTGRNGFQSLRIHKSSHFPGLGRSHLQRRTSAIRSVLTGDMEETEQQKEDSIKPAPDYLKVHFAESWNELHHLLVMEALGGDKRWLDRFLAQHIAVGYFFLTALTYTISPRMAYHFSECVERHAYSTYDKFIKQHGEELKKLPAPEVAVKYYTEGDLYMFDNLYDVFVNIREDEGEHCKTMAACQTPGRLFSPHTIGLQEKADIHDAKDNGLPPAECAGIVDCLITSSSFASRAQRPSSKASAKP